MRYHVYQFSDKTDNFDPNLFWPKFAKKIIFGLEIQKTNAGKKKSASLRYHVYQFLDKTDNFNFLVQICLEMNFGVGISEN